MYLTTFGSNRIYGFNKQIEKTIYKCSQIKFSAYNLYFFQQTNKELFEAKYGNISLHMILKNKFKIDDYYANSLLQDAKGVYKSQLEKDKLYKSNLKEKLKAVNNKLSTNFQKKLINMALMITIISFLIELIYHVNIKIKQEDPDFSIASRG